ncbi:MAG TPA: substrate-binding domain-containing protein [Vicinamibacteria bacterium]
MKTAARVGATALALALALAAMPALTQGAAPRTVKIAFIGKSYANPAFQAAHRGAQDAAVSLGRAHQITVQINVLTPPREDADAQVAQLATAVRQGVDAVIIAPSDAHKLKEAINQAVDQGVAVMTFDNDVPGSGRFAHYGVDDTRVGERVFEELAAQLGDHGKVGIIGGNLASENLKRRADGAMRAAAKHPGIQVLGPLSTVETPQDAAAEVLRVDAANPDIKGWAMLGGWPLYRSSQTPALVEDLRRREIKVVAVNALPEQLHYVEKGLAPVLLAQPVYTWGSVTVTTVVEKVHIGKKVPEHIPMELVRVTRESLATWARQLRDWGFKEVPTAFAP